MPISNEYNFNGNIVKIHSAIAEKKRAINRSKKKKANKPKKKKQANHTGRSKEVLKPFKKGDPRINRKGRPSMFKKNPEKYLKADEYIKHCYEQTGWKRDLIDTEVTEIKDKDGNVVETKEKKVYSPKYYYLCPPSATGYAKFIGIDHNTFATWRKIYKQFDENVNRVFKEKEEYIIKYGSMGLFNHQYGKLMLMTHHGYHEQKNSENKDFHLVQLARNAEGKDVKQLKQGNTQLEGEEIMDAEVVEDDITNDNDE